ncbi:hypothetical protein Avbf_14018, partial [Armadillidium vulgare]
MKKEQISD